MIDAYTRGVVADEQVSALAMAIYLGGMDRAETARWTGAMIRSGERMDFSRLGRPTADKHSTGGVGDKTTLPPLLRRNRTDLGEGGRGAGRGAPDPPDRPQPPHGHGAPLTCCRE